MQIFFYFKVSSKNRQATFVFHLRLTLKFLIANFITFLKTKKKIFKCKNTLKVVA